ncbi:MAG TPA: SDR family oxidoreductase [Cyanophyceae cyanobacterium]
MKQLANKKAVITGGSDGIGWGIAKAFAQNGADVYLIARNQEKLERASAELMSYGVEVKTQAADLSNIQAIQPLAAEILAEWSQIDILVNNAGTSIFTEFADVTIDEFDFQINLNVKSPYLLTQTLLPGLARAKGNVINISSYLAHKMLPGRPSTVYSLTKGAINSFTKSLAYELGSKGIRVNAIAPGTVNTPLVRQNLNKLPQSELRNYYESLPTIYPLGRMGEPDDLGGIAVYLASDEAKWVTGSIMSVDGGLTTN